MTRSAGLLAGFLLLGAVPAAAQGVEIRQPWARASIGANGVAYMTLVNPGVEPERLLSVQSPAAERAELHTHIREGDVMRMRPVEAITVPPGGEAQLSPGGTHVMLLGLRQPLREGDRLPLILRFERAGTKSVDAAVQGIGASGPSADHGHGTHR